MNILAIDSGSYSVKFFQGFLERKYFVVNSFEEIFIESAAANLSDKLSLEEIQYEIIRSYVGEDFVGKVIQHVPNDMITSRNLSIPMTNKKKALMMIPFQLEENLPFSSSEIHYAKTLIKRDQSFDAYLQVAKRSQFEELYDNLENRHILPAVLTSELAIYQSFIRENDFDLPAAILDVGHQSTKAYFIHNGEVILNHASLIAGAQIDKVISRTYGISIEEAVVYKHQNCFFLTKDQSDQVNKDQEDFANLMRQIFWPLIQDLKRWAIGYRVKYGHKIEIIYLTGGSSQINNFANFLSEEVEVKVEFLGVPHNVKNKTKTKIDDQNGLLLSCLMAQTQGNKTIPSNFLYGAFSGSSAQALPLHSLGFILSRVAMVTALLLGLLLLERNFFLQPTLKSMNKKISVLIKSPALGLGSRVRKQFRKKPEMLLKTLKKKNVSVIQEVKTIQASRKVDAFAPLGILSTLLSKNKNISLVEFRSDGKKSFAIFRGKSLDEVEEYEKKLKNLGLSHATIKLNRGSKSITLKFEDGK